MASANGSAECSAAAVPQWKRDLIQRRRQQNKVLTSNGASAKLCSAVSGTSDPTSDRLSCEEQHGVVPAQCLLPTARIPDNIGSRSELSAGSGGANRSCPQLAGAPTESRAQSPRGATGEPSAAPPGGDSGSPRQPGGASVVCNMRLEADVSSCPDETLNVNNASRNNHAILISSMVVEYENCENGEDAMRNYGVVNKRLTNNREQDRENGIAARIRRMDEKGGVRLYPSEPRSRSRTNEPASLRGPNGNGARNDECESDSSEELQYGPGIVNRLKSKYLNLTLREMNKTRASVQRFRRAASLEDLLDCDDCEQSEEKTRKYAKKVTSQPAKNDRYRNATRGNDSMKRARSVETLMRYNNASPSDENRFPGVHRQEPVNDHIVLIDRSVVKIESRLGESDRPKAVNKPKRIKPLLAETERPPPDLVKTTMRLFEGSVKKFKPKGEVAVKVATFKTINDTCKAQAMKKLVVPKPPVQPKPFANGKAAGSPKKIVVITAKSTAEMIEKWDGEEYRREGVVTETIVQSVSSVVSKFQQIEKSSYTPSASPEPSCYKLKFSPSPSPEPSIVSKFNRSNESLKSPPVTPVASPRIASPGFGQPPASPKKELARQHSSPTCQVVTSPPGKETTTRQISAPEVKRVEEEKEERDQIRDSRQEKNLEIEETIACEKISQEDCCLAGSESVDGARTISKSALENIGKAGTTMQYNFGDKPSIGKTYLPGGVTQTNGQKSESEESRWEISETKAEESSETQDGSSRCSSPISMDSINEEAQTKIRERLEPEKVPLAERGHERNDKKPSSSSSQPELPTKPLGAISSLALMISSQTTNLNTSDACKTIRNQKPDVSPPQKQIGIIRPLVSTKMQQSSQSLSNRELEKNLINRVKSIEQPTKVVVSLKSADEIQPVKKTTGSPSGAGGQGLWDTKPWNQANNTMVFNFSNRKDVPDYIENDGLIIRRKRDKQQVGDGGVIVLDATLDASTTDDSDWELSGGPPSPCDVAFTNDNVLINGRSNLSRQPRNHKHRIQFDDGATRTFEYPSESSMLEEEGTCVDGEPTSTSSPKSSPASSTSATMTSALLGGGGLASFTPSKVDLASEGFELGVTRTTVVSTSVTIANEKKEDNESEEYLKSDEDAAAWGAEATADLLY